MVRGKKPVHWCYVCETALAEAEVEYDRSYLAFDLREVSRPAPRVWTASVCSGPQPVSVHALIWTTTPWTLQAITRPYQSRQTADYVVATITQSLERD